MSRSSDRPPLAWDDRDAMPDLGPQELVREWKAAMQSLIAGARHAEVPRALIAPMERQVELLQEMVARAFGPSDAIFDLLEESGAAMRRQAEALSASAQALEQAAELMRVQAELFERTVRTVREPAEMAKSVARLERPRSRRRRHDG
jgi:hypothetical protein